MDIQQTLQKFKEKLDPRLDLFFDQKIQQAREISPQTCQMMAYLKEFTMRGGKRIRPSFTYFGYIAAGGRNKKKLLEVCKYIELIHSSLLIHDDIIDKDTIRRGKPTIHILCKRKYNKKNALRDSRHIGISFAIVLGELSLGLGYEILTDISFPDRVKIRALHILNEMIFHVGAGQMLDIDLAMRDRVTRNDILKVHIYKTAKYTVEAPLCIGAVLAGAGSKRLEVLKRYAIPLGIAFQIQDDILGLFGDEDKLGKPIGSDLREGKQTLLIFKALEKANKQEQRVIHNTLNNSNITLEQIKEIRRIVIKTGSLDYSKKLARKLALEAKEALEGARLVSEGKDFLIGVAEYLIDREY